MSKKTNYIVSLIILCVSYVFLLVLFLEYYIYSKQEKLLVMLIISLIIHLLIAFLIRKSLIFTILLVIGINLSFAIIVLLLFSRRILFPVESISDLIKSILFNFIFIAINGNWLIPFIVRNINILRKSKDPAHE
jgi:hypothetical protein